MKKLRWVESCTIKSRKDAVHVVKTYHRLGHHARMSPVIYYRVDWTPDTCRKWKADSYPSTNMDRDAAIRAKGEKRG